MYLLHGMGFETGDDLDAFATAVITHLWVRSRPESLSRLSILSGFVRGFYKPNVKMVVVSLGGGLTWSGPSQSFPDIRKSASTLPQRILVAELPPPQFLLQVVFDVELVDDAGLRSASINVQVFRASNSPGRTSRNLPWTGLLTKKKLISASNPLRWLL